MLHISALLQTQLGYEVWKGITRESNVKQGVVMMLLFLPPAAVVISLEAFHTTDTRHTHTRTTHSYVYIIHTHTC